MADFSTHADQPDPIRLIHMLAGFTWLQAQESRRFQMVLISSSVFAFMAIDAALRFPGPLDIATIKFVQRVHFSQMHAWSDALGLLTDSAGAVVAWGVTLVVFTLLRWWLPLLGTLAIPIGGVVNETISRVLIHRTRPHLEELRHVSRNFEERSFPSGHVVGAVLLYGFIWYVVGERIQFTPLRRLIRVVCVAIILLSGFDRVWSGAHWPSDVGGAYALGIALLLLLIITCDWIEHEADGLQRNEGVLAVFLSVGVRANGEASKGLRGRVQHLMIAIMPMVLALAPPPTSKPDEATPEAPRGH